MLLGRRRRLLGLRRRRHVLLITPRSRASGLVMSLMRLLLLVKVWPRRSLWRLSAHKSHCKRRIIRILIHNHLRSSSRRPCTSYRRPSSTPVSLKCLSSTSSSSTSTTIITTISTTTPSIIQRLVGRGAPLQGLRRVGGQRWRRRRKGGKSGRKQRGRARRRNHGGRGGDRIESRARGR